MAFTQVASLIYIEGSFELLTHPRKAAILSSYIIRRRTRGSLAIIRPVSLRLQNEGQKKTHGLSQMHTESLTTDFFDLCFSRCIGIINGFASVTACGC